MTDLKEVLRLVNSARKSLGKRPLKKMPKGVIGDDEQCPMRRACGVERHTSPVVAYKIATAWGLPAPPYGMPIPIPKVIRDFVSDFDAGKYPELVKKT